jgi:hypothetical protein
VRRCRAEFHAEANVARGVDFRLATAPWWSYLPPPAGGSTFSSSLAEVADDDDARAGCDAFLPERPTEVNLRVRLALAIGPVFVMVQSCACALDHGVDADVHGWDGRADDLDGQSNDEPAPGLDGATGDAMDDAITDDAPAGPCLSSDAALGRDSWTFDAPMCAADTAPVTFVAGCLLDCQTWAEQRLPGWDVGVECPYVGEPRVECVRADSCAVHVAPDGGRAADCSCGCGPACPAGYQCARPLASPDSPRACVCATASM